MFTSQAFRTAYLTECFNAQRELTSTEFISVLASQGIFITPMTAMFVSGNYDALEAAAQLQVEEEVQELATVWSLGGREQSPQCCLTS